MWIDLDVNKVKHRFAVATLKLNVPGIRFPVGLRPDTTDVFAFLQIFVHGCYRFTPICPPKLIVDGGANVGYASVWLANLYPQAQIIAIEPDEANFQLLRENTSPYANIRLIQAAIWNKPAHMKLLTHDANNTTLGAWGLRVEEVGDDAPASVAAITIDDILATAQRTYIDILKLDIEGAEKEVFSNNYANWLGRINSLIVETHDRFKAGCTDAVNRAVQEFGLKGYLRGENTFFSRQTALVE